MEKLNRLEDRDFLFGTLFVVSNKLDTALDRELSEYGVTSKQWLLSVVISTLFEEPPTLKKAAKEMGSSYQNVKQVALKLQQKKLIRMEKDEKDARATVLEMDKDSSAFWNQMNEPSVRFKNRLFEHVNPDDLAAARRVMQQLWNNLNKMEEEK